jgi:hypothetical protein
MKLPIAVLAALAFSSSAHAGEPPTHTLVLEIESLTPEKPDRLIRAARALEGIEGVASVAIDLGRSEVRAKFRADSADPQGIVARLERVGFHASFSEETRMASGTGRESAQLVTAGAKLE